MSDSASLTTLFLASLSDPLRARCGPEEALQGRLHRLVTQAQVAWPLIPYDAETFVVELAARMPEDVDLAEHLDTLPAPDLYLAYACGRSMPEAVAAFEVQLIPVVGRALGRIGAQLDAIHEVEQLLRERFLVGTGGRPPAATTYAGYGPLAAWVRVSALREYYGLARQGQRWQQLEESELTDRLDVVAPGVGPGPRTGPELGFLKEQYRPEFKAALTEALGCLEPRERNVLRHHYLDGLQVDQIGQLYRVHRVTASRWLAGARKAVLTHTRRLLTARLDINAEEFESIVRLIQSQLDLSLRTHLQLADDGS